MDTSEAEFRLMVAGEIRAQRARLGVRQQDIADRAGLSRTTLTDIEAGARKVTFWDVTVLCEALGVPLTRLMADAPEDVRHALGLPALPF